VARLPRDQLNVPYDPAEGNGRLRFDKFNGPSTDVVLVKLSYLWEPLSGHTLTQIIREPMRPLGLEITLPARPT